MEILRCAESGPELFRRGEALSIQDKENSNKQRLSKKGYTYELSEIKSQRFKDYEEKYCNDQELTGGFGAQRLSRPVQRF